MAEANPDYDGLVMVPITDGKRVFNLRCDLRKALENRRPLHNQGVAQGPHDCLHRRAVEGTPPRARPAAPSVQNAAYEQKDPLVIYKVESFHLFENMLNDLNTKAVGALMRGQIFIRQQAPAPQPRQADDDEIAEAATLKPKPQPELKRPRLPCAPAQLHHAQGRHPRRSRKPEPPPPPSRAGRSVPCPPKPPHA